MNFNHYFTNDEIQALIQSWCEIYPNLVKSEIIGYSHNKLPIWVIKITDSTVESDLEKPAVWIDANIHATELAGTTAALYSAYQLIINFESDPRVTRLLNQCVFYIIPRVNPDGAAQAMDPNPRYLRSGIRRYPWEEKDEGLHVQDINQDGKILQMRIPDPNGDWKISTLDPRLLEKRRPEENDGVYFRLLPEGMIEDYDGYIIKQARALEGLDFNRNFPFQWRTEGEQSGAGPYPASESEIRSLVDFVVNHQNINVALTFHTYSRVLLRPYSTKSDDDMIPEDLWVFKKMGEIGTRASGYRCVSTFHDFKYHPKEVTTGAFDDWVYDHLGIFSFTIELWDLPTEAGIKDRKLIEWWRDHPHEEDVMILKWIEEHGESDSYVPWQEYNHPQLGKIELGGWNTIHTWRNPPTSYLENEVSRHYAFILSLADMLPWISILTINVEPLGNKDYRIIAVVENNGFLPTFTSQQAKSRQAVRPVRVELEIPKGVNLITGKRRVHIGHLEGRSNKLAVSSTNSSSPTDNRGKAEWVVNTTNPASITIHVRSERAGSVSRQVTLGDTDVGR